MVGTSGAAGERFAVVTAIARTLPERTCGRIDTMVAKLSCTCPPISAILPGPPPLKGTCTHSTPVMERNSSPDRCTPVPTPAEPQLSCPGLDLASAISSCTVFTGNEGCTTSMLG